LKNPGLVRALLHIAYQRGNRKLPVSAVRDVAKRANMMETYAALVPEPEAGEADDPPALTSGPDRSSLTGSLENDSLNESSSVNGGDGSKTGSDGPDVTPVLTGTIR
jgi:hypothetical protein